MSQRTFIAESPQGRYKKWNECLGSGSFKKVYRGWDTVKGKDVAWNEIYVSELSEKEKDRFSSEVELLRSIEDEHFIKYYSSWYDPKEEKVVIITQIVTSGTLNNYVKGKQLTMEAIKRWSVQILEGLKYLHTRTPPIIHRDLKCSNIFIDGKTSKIMIGDLGLSKRRWEGAQMSIAGTPEFMAPEIFANGVYDEKVDIYAFGMCVLELITKKIPYGECHSIKDIYTKVTNGDLPDCFEDVKDEQAKTFIRKLIAQGPSRPSASELLEDPFLTEVTESDKKGIEVDQTIMERERMEKQGVPTVLSSIPVKDEFSPPSTIATIPDQTPEPVTQTPSACPPPNPVDPVPEETEKENVAPAPPVKPEAESKSENGPHTAPTIEISSLQEPVAPTPLILPSPTVQRSSSLTLSHTGIKNTHPSAIHQQRVIHRKTLSSQSYRHGNGSGTLSPSLMIANIQSPSRSHIHTVSLESVERLSQDIDTQQAVSSDIPCDTNDPSTTDCMPQLQLVFRGNESSSPKTPEMEEDGHSGSSEQSPKDSDEEVIDSINITLSKQEEFEFTFRIVCYYLVDKGGDHTTKSTWTQLVRYTYGVSKPENLVSDLISNGIIREGSLLPIAVAFEGWLNEVIYNVKMMDELEVSSEELEVLEKE